MHHLMIDVEALRLKQPWKAPLMEVGMVVFDEEARLITVKDLFIDPFSIPPIMSPEEQTVEFWKSQPGWPEMERRVKEDGIDVTVALRLIREVYLGGECQSVWFAGPTYDQVMLESYFDFYEIETPWKYNDARDYRTIRKQYPEILGERSPNRKPHFALSDAVYQVEGLRMITEAKGVTWR